MMSRSKLLGISVLVVALASMAGTGLASAQSASEDRPFTIQLVDLAPDSPLEVRSRTDHGTIVATVDGVECASVDASAPEPGRLVLGEAGQPEECSVEGATVVLYSDQSGEMWEKFQIAPGETVELGNYVPMPADTGAVAPASAGHGPGGDGSSNRLAVLAGGLAVLGVVLMAARGVSRA